MAKDMHSEGVIQPMEGVEIGSEASIVLPLIEPIVVPTGSELPSSLSTLSIADVTERP